MIPFLEAFILGVSLTLPLGPVTLEILRRGIKLGLPESLKTAIGAFCAELTFFTIVYFGLVGISENLIIKYVLGIIGVGFLFYLGYSNIMDYFSKENSFSQQITEKNSFISGYLITFLNPLNLFMWVGIIGVFFKNNLGFFVSTGVLYGIFISLFLVAFLSKIGNSLIKTNKMKYVSLIAGLFLVFYGLKLLVNLF